MAAKSSEAVSRAQWVEQRGNKWNEGYDERGWAVKAAKSFDAEGRKVLGVRGVREVIGGGDDKTTVC